MAGKKKEERMIKKKRVRVKEKKRGKKRGKKRERKKCHVWRIKKEGKKRKKEEGNVIVGSQIVAHTLTGTGNGPNKPNTINL